MRRAVIVLLLALPLTLGIAAASAHNRRPCGWGQGFYGSREAIAGTVESVNAANGTFVADAHVLTPRTFTGYRTPGGADLDTTTPYPVGRDGGGRRG